MVATINSVNSVAAGAKFLEPVVSVLRESLHNPHDLKAGTLNNPTTEALATFLVTVIRADGDHVSPTDINAYLKSLCQNDNTSFENRLIGEAAQIALDALNPNNTATLSHLDVGAEASISGFLNRKEGPSLEQEFAAILAQKQSPTL